MPAPVNPIGLSLPLTAGPIPTAAGVAAIYSKGDNKFYALLNDGTELQVGPSIGPTPGGTGNPNAIVYNDPLGATIVGDNALTAAPVDQFGRPQILDRRQNGPIGPVFRQGGWTADGDPVDETAEGIVLYGPNANGAGPNATDGGYNRQKPDRIGIAQIINGVNGNALFYGFRADFVRMFLTDNFANNIFEVNRATPRVSLGAATELLLGGTPGAVGEVPVSAGPGASPAWGVVGTSQIVNDGGSLSIDGTGNFNGIIPPGSQFTLMHNGTGAAIVIDAVGNFTLIGAAGNRLVLLSTGSAQLFTAGLTMEITNAGELLLNGNPGVAGQRITSAGPGLPPVWA